MWRWGRFDPSSSCYEDMHINGKFDDTRERRRNHCYPRGQFQSGQRQYELYPHLQFRNLDNADRTSNSQREQLLLLDWLYVGNGRDLLGDAERKYDCHRQLHRAYDYLYLDG